MHYPFQPLLSPSSTTPNVNINNVTDSVVDLSEAISKYGIAIVIMAVFFVIFMILIVVMLYSNTKMINQIISSKSASDKQDQDIINKLVDNALEDKGMKDSDVIINTLTRKLDDKLQPIKQAVVNGDHEQDDYHRDLVGAYIDINMAFKDISRATMNELKCDRVAIYVFHNGNKSMHGLPFFKMSCIHEWTTHGTSTLRGKSHMDMPLHLFNDFIENLYRSGIYRSENVKKSMEDDPSIKEFVAFSDIESLYLVAVKDNDGALAGFVAAEFANIDTFEQDEQRDNFVRSIIDNMVSKVAPIVGNKYILKRNEE